MSSSGESTPSDNGNPEPSPTPVGEVTIWRGLADDHSVVVGRGSFSRFFDGYLDHARRWNADSDPLGQNLMRQALSGAVLHLASRPKDEVCGWTLYLAELGANVFVTGDSSRLTVTGRYITEDVKPQPSSRLYVQSRRPATGVFESTIEVSGLDVLLILEQFSAKSNQVIARFFEDDAADEVIHLLALPGADEEWLASLDRDAAWEFARSNSVTPLESLTYRFQCGCDTDRMKRVIESMFGDDLDELFEDQDALEITCPRCARTWDLERSAFDE